MHPLSCKSEIKSKALWLLGEMGLEHPSAVKASVEALD